MSIQTPQEYTQWRRSLSTEHRAIANVAALYHANVTAEMLQQAYTAMRQLQENHNYLESRYAEMQREVSDLKRRVIELEQFFNANDSSIPES